MPLLSDRVQETSTTTGTGTLTLAGAVTGYRSFNASFTNGDVVFYTIDDTLGNWEVGSGTVGTGTLTRATVIVSSNANALVNFGAGAKRVFCSAPTRALLPNQTGNSGKFLTTDGTSPSWSTVTAGTVTSVSGTGTVSGITLSGAVTTSGSLTLGGTLDLSAYNAAGAFTNLSYTGTLTGGTGVIAIGTNQIYKDASGNVGIGTSSPAGKLSVKAASSGDGIFIDRSGANAVTKLQFRNEAGADSTAIANVGTADAMSFETGGNTERMRIDASGNVGIGTNSPGYKLDVFSNLMRIGNGSPSYIAFGAYTTDLNNYIVGVETGSLAFYQGKYGGTSTERMRIDASGNVGIGTNSPATKLHVTGTSTTKIAIQIQHTGSSGSYPLLTLAQGGSSPGVAGWANASIIEGAADGGLVLDSYVAPLVLQVGRAERLRIDTSGNVGIGTSSVLTKLDIVGPQVLNRGVVEILDTTALAAGTGAGITLGGYYTVGALTPGVQIKAAKTNGTSNNYSFDMAFLTYSNGDANMTERMRIDSSGNLLVGTTSGSYKLHVESAGSTSIYLNNSSNAVALRLIAFTNACYIQTQTNHPLYFATNNGAVTLAIAASGEVLAGGTTDNGAYNLQCNGTGVWGAGAYVNGSDERIKESINPIESSIDIVNKLKPVTYRYKESWSKDRSIQAGFIAQDLQIALADEIYLDGIVQQGTEYMSVAYQNIIPILTKAIQELHAEIETLKQSIH